MISASNSKKYYFEDIPWELLLKPRRELNLHSPKRLRSHPRHHHHVPFLLVWCKTLDSLLSDLILQRR